MKRKRVFPAALVLTILLLLSLGPSAAQGPEGQRNLGPVASTGTAFTYQGRLSDNGTPIDDTCDFQFELWDDSSAGSLVAGPLDVIGTSVVDGRFTTQLDFGDLFDGTAFWLEIAVQCSGDSAYTTLSPRQALTAAPYAVTSQHSPWSGITAMPAGFADDVDDDTIYSAGAGLVLTGTVFSADPTVVQWRVTGDCERQRHPPDTGRWNGHL